jgi:hypothetical protein
MLKRLREWLAVTLALNFTTSVVGATNTALTFQIKPNETWVVDMQLTASCSGTGGLLYAISTPAGATIEGWLYSSLGAITTLSYQRLNAINTLIATPVHTVATTPSPDVIRFTIVNGATAGSVTLQVASKTAGQISSVLSNSSLIAYRVV